MSFDTLTTKTLPLLIKYLNGCEVVKIRKVCKTWKNIVDFSEEYWKELCQREYGAVEEAQRKSSLTWRELFKSLSLWSKINSAKMDYYESPALEDELLPRDSQIKRKFTIVKNNLIAYPGYIGESISDCYLYYNTIYYYDAENLSEHHHETFDFLFDYYVESDQLYVFRTCRDEEESNLLVIAKANKKKFLVGKNMQYDYGDFSNFFLLKNNLYFKSKDSIICVSKLKEENGEVTLETTPLDRLTVEMVAMSLVNDNHVNILTYRGHIFSLKDKKTKCVYKIDKSDSTREIIWELKEHSFDWSSPEVYKWLSRTDNAQITKLKNAVLFKEGKCIIIGTGIRTLHIYDNPYKLGELVLYITPKPTLKVDLSALFPFYNDDEYGSRYRRYSKIEQIDVIEIVNGHRIVVLYCNKLVIVEFRHNYSAKRTSTLTDAQDVSEILKRARLDTYLQPSTSSATV